jgi:Family of unknown function (DUF6807)
VLKLAVAFVAGVFAVGAASLPARVDDRTVTVTDRPSARRVDVSIAGQPFTSYIYPESLQKPVLYPIRSAGGAFVTRGFPLDPRPGERADHPHHVGHWFNYGDVNGYDFWGHSSATPAENLPKMGTILHKEVTRVASGPEQGELVVRADWVVPGATLLREQTRFVFSGGSGRRAIDRITTWTAADKPVTFNDTKEGAFGIRVARGFEQPSTEPETFVDARGQKEVMPRRDTSGATGQYIGSDGQTGAAVWGTRGPWLGLTGLVDGKPITLAIFDHPSNHGHPTYWHARGYGLFAANPFGRKGYDPEQDAVTFTLEPGESMTFTHRILVLDGKLTREQLQQEHERYVKDAAR